MLLPYPLGLRRGVQDVGLVCGDDVEGKLVLRDGEEENKKQGLVKHCRATNYNTRTYVW